MSTDITINGRPVGNAEDQRVLRHLLNVFPAAHNGDSNIDEKEAARLLDTNDDGRVDALDLLDHARKSFGAEEFHRALRIFSNAGMKKLTVGEHAMRASFLKLAEEQAEVALQSADQYQDQPYALEVIGKAIDDLLQSDPWSVLKNYDKYKGIPDAALITNRATWNLAQRDPAWVLSRAKEYRQQPYAGELIGYAAVRDPQNALLYADHYKDEAYAWGVIRGAAEKYPRGALHYAEKYRDKPFAADVIERAAEAVPSVAVEYRHPHPVFTILRNSKTPASKAIVALINASRDGKAFPYGVMERMAVIIDMIVRGKGEHARGLTMEEAKELVNDDTRYFNAIAEIASRPDAIGRYDIDHRIKEAALRTAAEINRLHASHDAERFKAVEGASAASLYVTIVNSLEEMFPTSFNGLFTRLISAMRKERVSGDALLMHMEHKLFRTFIKLCASYNRLNDFLDTMPVEKRKELLTKFVSDLDASTDMLSDAVSIADAFSMISDAEILALLQKRIQEEYVRVTKKGDKKAKALYGLLAGMFGRKAVVNAAWIQEMSKAYRLPDLMNIRSRELFTKDGANIQHHVFYADADGQSSFKNFLSQYRRKPGWTIEEKRTYVVIRSAPVRGKSIEIYANKPTSWEVVQKASEDIQHVFQKKKVHPTVFVQRGHSYHVVNALSQIPRGAKIVSLGSCGGYNNVSAVLEKAPAAHIIATKGTGTMWVNDPLFKMLNETMLEGDIHWPTFWGKAAERFKHMPAFDDYIPPHANLGVMFLKAYQKMLEKK